MMLNNILESEFFRCRNRLRDTNHLPKDAVCTVRGFSHLHTALSPGLGTAQGPSLPALQLDPSPNPDGQKPRERPRTAAAFGLALCSWADGGLGESPLVRGMAGQVGSQRWGRDPWLQGLRLAESIAFCSVWLFVGALSQKQKSHHRVVKQVEVCCNPQSQL